MSGLQRVTRHPDRINDPHARAHALASDALLGPLDAADATWLDDHLAACDPCLTASVAFAEDAELLRGLRADLPPAPRDLGARVSFALDAEQRRGRRRRGDRGGRRASWPAFGRPGFAFAGLAAVAVVALLVAPLAFPMATVPVTAPPAGTLAPAATPIVVDSQPVAWVRRQPDGTYVLASADVRRVCAGVDATACGTLDGGAETLATLSMKPTSVLLPRDGSPAVVVGQNAVFAIAVNLAQPVTTPGAEASPVPTSEPVQSPSASGEPASPPVGSPAPSDLPVSPDPGATAPVTPGPTGLPHTIPPATPAPSAAPAVAIAEQVVLVGAPPAYSANGQWVAFSARPADGGHGPDIYAWHVGDPTARILTDDHGSVFSGWVDDRIIVSTARVTELPAAEPSGVPSTSASPGTDGSPVPAVSPDASTTPGPEASAATSPAADVSPVASPVPAALPGAAPTAEADPATVVARSFLISPDGTVLTEIGREGIWRPVVDPTERVAVFWTGSLAWSATDQAWLPGDGRLVAADWQTVLGQPIPEPTPTPDPNVTPDPNASATPAPTATPTPEPTPTPDPNATIDPNASATPSADPAPAAPLDQELPAAVVGSDVVEWEVRFDPAGRSLGVWVADPAEPGTGRLSLVAVESDGSLGYVLLADAAALPGFSVGADRLAWSTPPGRNGQGSLVTVFAWSGGDAGQLYGMPDPGEEPIVVVR